MTYFRTLAKNCLLTNKNRDFSAKNQALWADFGCFKFY